ncbi:MAG: hypothetical protein V2I79_06570 [Xanthomonadales bacterium]|jgi:hypothetical protein|nr:hypothetical protein [Xanthomonadales bacterium]
MIDQVLANPVARVLAGVCAGLLLLNGMLGLAWLLPPTGSDGGVDAAEAVLGGQIPELPPAEPIDRYAEITARPLFNESRQPIIGLAENDEDETEPEEEVVEAPEVELVGIVITPDMRIATLREKNSKEPVSLIALEGQPLEGDYGSWRISTIEPRAATLESARGEQVLLELQMHDEVIEEPPELVRQRTARQAAEDAPAAGEAGEQPMNRAEEIRQRIAERREELQRAAEEGEQAPRTTPPDYRSAIQKMMLSRKNDKDDESEQ